MMIREYRIRGDCHRHIHRDHRSPKTPLPLLLASPICQEVSLRPQLDSVPATTFLVIIKPHNLYYRKQIERD